MAWVLGGRMLEASIDYPLKNFTLNADLSIAQGTIVGVFGPSGAGKSTLLACIAGLIKGQSVSNHQQSLSNLTPDKRGISLQLQSCPLFPHLNVQMNLAFSCKHRAVNNNQLELKQIISLLGIEDLLDREVATLSGGERQRIIFARTLLLGQNIVLLDEPFSALDWHKKQRLLSAIKLLAKQKNITFIIVSHSLKELSYCADKLLQLEAGHIKRYADTAQISQTINNEQHTPQFSFITFEVVKHLPEYNLTKVQLTNSLQTLYITNFDDKNSCKICINASDVIIHHELNSQSSDLNILTGTLISYEIHQYEVLLCLNIDAQTLLCSMSLLAWEQLGLNIGQTLHAQLHSI